jgi:hypothetical protein
LAISVGVVAAQTSNESPAICSKLLQLPLPYQMLHKPAIAHHRFHQLVARKTTKTVMNLKTMMKTKKKTTTN